MTAGGPSLDGRGTPEATWRAGAPFDRLPTWVPERPAGTRAVVVAPHPDDEILGAGGILSQLQRTGSETVLVAVTDGEASHRGREAELRRRRPIESAQAASALGIRFAEVRRLGHRDGAVDPTRLSAELEETLQPGDLVLAPWWMDGHPDHDEVGRAARRTAAIRGSTLCSYLVWAWHWATPADLPWPAAGRVDLAPALAAAKRAAIDCFVTQLAEPDPVLPPHVVERLTRGFEVVLRS